MKTAVAPSSSIWPIFAVLGLGTVIAFGIAFFPFVLAQDFGQRPNSMRALLAVLLLFESAFALVLALDAGAFLYGTKRPSFSASRRLQLVLGEPSANNAFSFALTAFGSYFLTLSCFAITYLVIAQLDPNAFGQPLSSVAAIYYTVGSAVTAGAGEIAAKSSAARLVTTFEYCVAFAYNVFIFAGLAGFAAKRTVSSEIEAK